MDRLITIILSIALLICGGLHVYFGGLLVQVERRVIFSNELLSSGSDSSFLVCLGLMIFLVSLISGLRRKGMYLSCTFSVLFFDFMLFLANLDVPLIESVKHGDFTLLVAFILAHFLIAYHLTSKGIGLRKPQPLL
ncbi:hypothetical protein QT397_20600 [Microbulbifer sp. MKSA007]|nr:hypothetical protein QT397_20600 [Microbulbifer sp. MKSA007]